MPTSAGIELQIYNLKFSVLSSGKNFNMKLFPVLFLIVFVFGKPETKAQSVLPPIGTEWWYEYISGMMSPPVYYGYGYLTAVGDTSIDSHLCRKLHEEWRYDGVHNHIDRYQFVYEDSGRVYCLVDSVFGLLYDFTKAPGDSFNLNGGLTLYSGGIDTALVRIDSTSQLVLLNNDTLKVENYTQPQTPSWDSVCWFFLGVNGTHGAIIERIGDIGYFFTSDLCTTDQELPWSLRCYAEGGNILWHPSTFPCDTNWIWLSVGSNLNSRTLATYPNPTAGLIQLEIYSPENLPTEFFVFDALGRKFSTLVPERTGAFNFQIDVHTLPSGIYFLRIGNQFAKFVKE